MSACPAVKGTNSGARMGQPALRTADGRCGAKRHSRQRCGMRDPGGGCTAAFWCRRLLLCAVQGSSGAARPINEHDCYNRAAICVGNVSCHYNTSTYGIANL